MNRALQASIGRTIARIILEQPFFGYFLSRIVKVFSGEVEYLAIGFHQDFPVLLINPDYWEKLPDHPHRSALLQHEALHLIFHHYIQRKDYAHPMIFDLAADLCVNQWVAIEQHFPGAPAFSHFSGLDWLPFQPAVYYYRQLEPLWLSFLRGKPLAPEQRSAAEKVHSFLSVNGSHLRKHRFWDNPPGTFSTAAFEQTIDEWRQTAIRQSTDRVGAIGIPGRLEDLLALEPVVLPAGVYWRKALRLFACGSRKTVVKETIRRPSGRYGSIPGIAIRQKKKLLIAVDTSGSVKESELALFFSEIHHLWRQNVEILVVECDAMIRKMYFYKGSPPSAVQGRGGTNLDPPIRWANEHYLPDGILYFTDGLALPPSIRSRAPLLWIITAGGIEPGGAAWDQLPGKKIKLRGPAEKSLNGDDGQ